MEVYRRWSKPKPSQQPTPTDDPPLLTAFGKPKLYLIVMLIDDDDDDDDCEYEDGNEGNVETNKDYSDDPQQLIAWKS